MMEKVEDEDEVMDEFMEKFCKQKYEGAFNEEQWEEEFERIPMFMKTIPDEVDPEKVPELACLQSILSDDPEVQATSYKEEGNDYFIKKDYRKAVEAYTEGIRKKCPEQELNAVLHTNRAAAHFHLGNYRSSLNDVIVARKLKPDHLKAITRGALCYMEIKQYEEAMRWCQAGLNISPTDRKLLETRTKADKLQRAADRDDRRMKQAEKKLQTERSRLLAAIHSRGIRMQEEREEEEETSHDGISTVESVTGAQVCLGDDSRLLWPVLFLYPEHSQTDFISAFHEDSRFRDHLTAMFSEDPPPWDTDRKYRADSLEVYFEDEESECFYQLDPDCPLLEALQHSRFRVKAGTPSFLIFVQHSPFCRRYFSDKRVQRIP